MNNLPLSVTIRSRGRVIFLIFLAAVFSAAAGFFFIRFLVKPFTGFAGDNPELASAEGRLVYAARTDESPGLKAGLVPGKDEIVAVDSVPIRTIHDLVRWESGSYSFAPVTILARDQTGSERTLTLFPELSVKKIDWFFTLILLVILGGIAFYVMIHYHDEPAQVLFAFFCLFYMVYASVLPFYYESLLTVFFVNLGELAAWFAVLIVVLIQRDVFPVIVKRIIALAVFAVSLLTIFLRFYLYFRWSMAGGDADFELLRSVGQAQNSLDFIAYLIFIALLIALHLKTASRELKHHIEWIAAGALLALPPHFIFNQLPVLFGQTETSLRSVGSVSNLFLAFLPLFYIIGLTQARGFRLKVFQTRSLIYLVISFVLLAFFTVFYQPVQYFYTEMLKLNPAFSGFIVALSLFILALYLQFMILLVVEKRISYDKRYENTLEQAARRENLAGGHGGIIEDIRDAELEMILKNTAGRFGRHLDEIRKKCSQAEKYLSTRGFHQDPSGIPDNEHPLLKLFRSLDRHFVESENLKNRFSVITDRKTSIRILVSVKVLVGGVSAHMNKKHERCDIQFRGNPKLKVYCSPEEIMTCLAFLVENAIESLSEKTDPIQISAEERGECVVITVIDRGNGIPARNLPHVGRPFFSTKKGHDGLGLYFARILAGRNRGFLQFSQGSENETQAALCLPKNKIKAETAAERVKK